MNRPFGTVAYWTAFLVSAAFILAVSIAIVTTYVDFMAHAELWSQAKIQTVVVGYGALFVSAVAAFSGVFFGWRKDRRDVRELELKLRELEHRLGKHGK